MSASHDIILPALLDTALAIGYYRFGQTIDTDYLIRTPDGGLAYLLWARISLAGYVAPKRYHQLRQRCAGFSLQLHPGQLITGEIEALYARYHAAIDFDHSATATAYLLGTATVNAFPTSTWLLRDGSRLIGVCYVDNGVESTAGILNFFDPDYRDAYSPGIFLYLHAVAHAATQGMRHFYPGYIAIGYSKFDYKLVAGKGFIELWDAQACEWKACTRLHIKTDSGNDDGEAV